MTDPFLWLEELTSEKSLNWVDQQNQRTLKRWTQDESFQSLRSQILHLYSQKDKLILGSVFKRQCYQLWQDQEVPLGIWRRAPLEGLGEQTQWEVQLNLDQYSLQKNEPTFLKDVQFLPGSSRVLLSLSPQGKDAVEIREFDIEEKKFIEGGFFAPLSKDEMNWVNKDQVVWASAQKPTQCGYPSQIFIQNRGDKPRLVLEVPQQSMSAWPVICPDSRKVKQIFLVNVQSWDDRESFYVDGDKVIPTGLPLSTGIHGIYQDRLVLWLDKPWNQFPAGSVLISKTEKKYANFVADEFALVFEPSESKSLQSFEVYDDGIALSYTDNLRHKVDVWTPEKVRSTSIPEGTTVEGIFSSKEGDQLFTSFQSFTEPLGWYVLAGGQWNLIKKAQSYFNTDDIEAKQEWATSLDGTQVPYWLVYNKNFSFPRPTIQYGYGGFLSAKFPFFSNTYGCVWLSQGGILVLAQIRGGSEFGVPWHEAARKENKQKSYDDFIAISEDLIKKGYTTAKQLAIRGRSNGGLLVGATITQRPDLYGAALIEVPLLDMLRYADLPPGSSWVDEYGDPHDPKFREIILKYSPYQNVEKNPKYPPILIRTARSDDRVHPGHARKMAAKLQSQGHEAWYFEEELGGHGSTPIQDLAFQEALVFKFFRDNLA